MAALMGVFAIISAAFNGYGIYSQSVDLCNQISSIGQQTDELNVKMEAALKNFEILDAQYQEEILEIQMQIADDEQKLTAMHNQYLQSHAILQISVFVIVVAIVLLLYLKYNDMLDWHQFMYITLAMLAIAALAGFFYTLSFPVPCNSTITVTPPTYRVFIDTDAGSDGAVSDGCQCQTDAQCPFGCQQGCWQGQLNWSQVPINVNSIILQIVDVNGNVLVNEELPTFSTSYNVDIADHDYAPLQVNLGILDQSNCPGALTSSWFINQIDYKSTGTISFLTPDQTQALTATATNVTMTPYSQSPSQKWTLWIDQSVNSSLFVLQNAENKLLGEVFAPFSSTMAPISDSTDICVPNGCMPCIGGMASHRWTQAFGLYRLTSSIGIVALYYMRGDGVYGMFNNQTYVFENSQIAIVQPLTDAVIQPQWRLLYTND